MRDIYNNMSSSSDEDEEQKENHASSPVLAQNTTPEESKTLKKSEYTDADLREDLEKMEQKKISK
jgi:hypothetical protein